MNQLAKTFFEDIREGKYNFLVLEDEPEKNSRLYNLFVSVMDNLDRKELRIYTTNNIEDLVEKYKLKGIKIETVQKPNFDVQKLLIINTEVFTENLDQFYNN